MKPVRPKRCAKRWTPLLQSCGEITNIRPDPSFDAWAEDSLLDNGVAINPQAAAHCAIDYEAQREFLSALSMLR